MIDDKTLTRAVKALGTTPRGIARKLGAAGIRGEVGDPQCCAVAVYLHAQFPDEDVFEVSGAEILVNGAKVQPHDAVAEFINEFDDHTYPELIAHRDDCSGVELEDDDWVVVVSCGCLRLDRSFYDGAAGYRANARAYLARAQKAFA